MIEVKNLTKRYGQNLALDRVSFKIEEGTIVGFLGPNGAGKSTAMNIITGYLSATSGEVTVSGKNTLEEPGEVKKMIGYLPELPPLYMDMTVKEYLYFMYELKKAKLPREQHIQEICRLVKIENVFNRLIANLSKGYKQRVGIAQALIGNPPVLILDEPTVGLDPKQIIEIRTLIKNLGRNHTVILSSHILPEVQAVCERILVINNGRIVADGATDTLAHDLSPDHRLILRRGPGEGNGTRPAERARRGGRLLPGRKGEGRVRSQRGIHPGQRHPPGCVRPDGPQGLAHAGPEEHRPHLGGPVPAADQHRRRLAAQPGG